MPEVKQGKTSYSLKTLSHWALSTPAQLRARFRFTSFSCSIPLLTAFSSLSLPALVFLVIIAHYYRASLVWAEKEVSFITVTLKPVAQPGKSAGSWFNSSPALSLLSPEFLPLRLALYNQQYYSYIRRPR